MSLNSIEQGLKTLNHVRMFPSDSPALTDGLCPPVTLSSGRGLSRFYFTVINEAGRAPKQPQAENREP